MRATRTGNILAHAHDGECSAVWAREMQHETPLRGGRTTTGVVRIGDTVHRPMKPHASFVHELLRHLERQGFGGAPRFRGVDASGREILTYIPGFVPPELGYFTDDQLAEAARLLRDLHDATLDCPLRNGRGVVCHGDASPCNCVFVDGMPIGFIDFDNAHAGSRLEDLGYASWLWIDIGNDDLSADLQGRRIAHFFWSYGYDSAYAVDSILDAQTALHDRAEVSGVREWSNDCRAWVENNRAELIAAIAARYDNLMQPTRCR